MVASARGRKSAGVAEQEPGRANPTRTPDGRRHIFGLSQAIREKAFQSTSPSSEAKLSQHAPRPNQVNGHAVNHQVAPQTHQKNPGNLTIEERLRNLLNSDTEGPDDKKGHKAQPSNHPTRFRSNTPGPPSHTSPQKPRDMNRTPMGRGDPHNGRLVQRTANGDYVLVNRAHNGASPSNVRTNPGPAQPRRCTSAVPASFMHQDENWNKVPEHHAYQQPPVRSRATPSPGVSRDPRSPNPSPSSQAQAHQPQVQQSRTSQSTGKPQHRNNSRPASALRRSLCFENETSEPHMTFNPDPTSQALSMRLVAPTYQQHMQSPQSQHHSTPNAQLNRQARSYENIVSERHDYLGRKPQNVQHSPTKSFRPESATQSPNNKMSPTRSRVINDVITSPKRGDTRTHYPQQNFSFRRAVHHSVSSDSVHCAPGDTSRSPPNSDKLPHGDDRDTRKSDDRDSGTVLEPEASVFDFDSSILSEEAEVPSPTAAGLSPPKEAWSRSSTPLLPPLSFPEEGEEDNDQVVGKEEAAEKAKLIAEQHFVKHHPQVNLRRVKSECKAKDHPIRSGAFSPPLGVNEELSPTESALSDVKARQLEQRAQPKVLSSKLQRGASTVRRGFHPKNLSGDERSRVSKKQRQRRRYDDSDVTDWSQQQETYRISDRRQSAYYRHSSVTIDASELGETSSVRSITTTSVCSGALRKSARRRRQGLAGSDRYSREIRSVNKRFTRLEAHVVTLARSLAQLSSELRHQSVTSREIDQLRQQVQEIKSGQQNAVEHRRSQPQIILKSEGKQPKLSSKLAKFFGDQPPLLHLFLKQLGYEKYIKNFECERIGMMELPYMDEKRLHDIGIPLGPRLRILKEAQKSSYV